MTLVRRVRLGKRVLIHPGAVLGADGFGLAMEGGRWLKVPQLGGVVVGDDCEIGANTTIDRGALDDTVLEEDVRLDNQIQIGHNAHIGAHTAMAGCSAVAGSARIGRYCLIGGGAGVLGPPGTVRPRHRHRDEPGHPFDPRARRVFIGHATDGQSQLAQERRPLQAARQHRPARAGRDDDALPNVRTDPRTVAKDRTEEPR